METMETIRKTESKICKNDEPSHFPMQRANGIRTGDHRGFNKGRNSKFRVGSRVRQTPEEGWRTYRPKRCGNNNKDEDNSPKTLNDKNQQASSQKFRQLISSRYRPDTVYQWKQLEKLNQKLARMTNHLTV